MRSILLLVTTLIVTACDPCRNLDCIANDYEAQLRIVRAADNKDLLFGASRLYDRTAIRFFSLQGTDTVFFESRPVYLPGSGYDSILLVRFFPKVDTAFMYLGNGDVDTLQLQYKTFGTKCCGTITEIENMRYNNSLNLPGKGTQEIRK